MFIEEVTVGDILTSKSHNNFVVIDVTEKELTIAWVSQVNGLTRSRTSSFSEAMGWADKVLRRQGHAGYVPLCTRPKFKFGDVVSVEGSSGTFVVIDGSAVRGEAHLLRKGYRDSRDNLDSTGWFPESTLELLPT
jgi:hypothetical protein